MADRYIYVTKDNKKIGVVTEGGDTSSVTWTNYSGNVKIYFSKYDMDLTNDTDEPSFNERFHYALVWGALSLMGFERYEKNYNEEIRRANQTKGARRVRQLKQYDY